MAEANPPLLENATADLARFASELRFEDLPDEVVERIKLCVLDHIGCCLYGATLPWTRRVAALAYAESAAMQASLFGYGRKTSVALAALVNGTAGHAFELDDIHKESILHPGSLAMPAVLALLERDGGRGTDAITALVAGYEVGVRVGNAATMELFFRGFHPQGTSGVFVAAAAAARWLDLSPEQFQHALGIAGSQAGGLMAAQEGAMVKRFHSGRAAQSGVYAALLAQAGLTGTLDVLEAPYGGFLSSYSNKSNATRLTAGLGDEWETAKVGYKPHASVTSIHAAQDALAALMHEYTLEIADIAKVEVGLSRMTWVHCVWEYKAQGVTAAQMNLYYGLAVIACDGVAFTAQYREDRLADPGLLDFARRIDAQVDPQIDAMGAAFRHAARVRLTTVDGRVVEKTILHRRGSPENPLSPEDIRYKFRCVTESCLSRSLGEKVISLVDRLDALDDLGELIDILALPSSTDTH